MGDRGRSTRRALAALAAVGLVAVALVAAPGAQAADHVELRSGSLTATVTLDPFAISVADHGRVLLETADPGRVPVGERGPLSFAVGARVAAQPPLAGYGILADAPLAWFHATRAEPRDDGSLL